MVQPAQTSTTENRCMQCDEPTKFKCKGCEGGLDGHGETCEAFYCSKDCQTAHWETHKSACKNARYRKQLYRAGELTQKIFMDMRKAAFIADVKKVEKKEGIIYTKDGGHVNRDLLFKFPEDMLAGPEDHEVLLSHASGPPALMMMHKFVTSALHGSYKKIHGVCASIPNENALIICTNANVGSIPHAMFKVDLKDGNSYALDICGAQCGLRQSTMLWDDYCSKLAPRIIYEECSGTFGTERDRHEFRHLQRRIKEGQSDVEYEAFFMLLHGNITRCVYTAINTMLADYKLSAAELLKLSGVRYKQLSGALVWFVQGHVQAFTETLKRLGPIHYMTRFPNTFEAYLERAINATNKQEDEALRAKLLAKFMWPEFAEAFLKLEPKKEEEPKFRLVDQGDVLHIFPA